MRNISGLEKGTKLALRHTKIIIKAQNMSALKTS